MERMAEQYETSYVPLGSYDDSEENELPIPEAEVLIHEAPERSNSRWNHVENLDDFFTRVYHYHQRNGFACMVMEDILQLVQFVFVILFSTFLWACVDYDVLFGNVKYNTTHKVTIAEAVRPLTQCAAHVNFILVISLIVASAFWLFRVIKVIYNIFKYWEIRCFYQSALKISPADLCSMTWHEVQRCMLDVQKDQHMCIHKQELTELDIYHRILRFKNYMIAMVNKSILPLTYRAPFLGDCAFLSTGLKYNLEFILFWGPWAAFENNWHLKKDFKSGQKRKQLANTLSQRILWIGVANFLLFPLILVWQILYSFFRYGEIMKREPAFMGVRRWSNYARHYLRHFNELDHEFNARLSRGYKAANAYMNIFTTPLLIILAKNIAFFVGSILAVLVLLTVIDEDVLNVEHILTSMTIAGLIVTACRVIIPDDYLVYCPEQLLLNVLAHIHYMPESWKGNAHTFKVRDEFALLFHYKIMYIIEELLSPIFTPIILCFCIRAKSLDIVDFFHNFTVEVVGVGDVCSFAQMDIRKHGNPQWVPEHVTEATRSQQAEDGKTALSLMHFHLANPEWQPSDTCSLFIHNLKEQAQKDAITLSSLPLDNPVLNSLYSLGSPALGLSSPVTSSLSPLSLPPTSVSFGPTQPQFRLRGAVSQSEGPVLGGSTSGLRTSIHSSLYGSGSLGSSAITLRDRGMESNLDLGTHASNITGGSSYMYDGGGIEMGELGLSSLGLRTGFESIGTSFSQPPRSQHRQIDEGTIELLSRDMSFSALYMHELRHRRVLGMPENLDYFRMQFPGVTTSQRYPTWPVGGGASATASTSHVPLRQDSNSHMPDIAETPQEEERELSFTDQALGTDPLLGHKDVPTSLSKVMPR